MSQKRSSPRGALSRGLAISTQPSMHGQAEQLCKESSEPPGLASERQPCAQQLGSPAQPHLPPPQPHRERETSRPKELVPAGGRPAGREALSLPQRPLCPQRPVRQRPWLHSSGTALQTAVLYALEDEVYRS